MILLVLVLVSLFGILMVAEIATVMTYGFYIKKFDLDEFKKKAWLNSLDHDIICSRSGYFIDKAPNRGLISKYYIYGKGTVLRFSKLEREIDKYYDELLKQLES